MLTSSSAVPLVKTKTLALVRSYHPNSTMYHNVPQCTVSPLLSSSVPGLSPGYHIVSCQHTCIVSFGWVSVSLLFCFLSLFFMILTVLKGNGQVLCRMSVNLGSSDVFSWLDRGDEFEEQRQWKRNALLAAARWVIHTIGMTRYWWYYFSVELLFFSSSILLFGNKLLSPARTQGERD